MKSSTKYLQKEKIWESGLLWRHDEVCLPNSLKMATRRLKCLESKILRDPAMKMFLVEKIIDYEKKGYIRKLNQSEVSHDEKSWFIAIFTVRNKNKNKTRIVWDATATVNNISLIQRPRSS